MIDFKKLMEDSYRRATPKERARIDAYNEREARYDLTRRSISATFIRYASKSGFDFTKGKETFEEVPIREWTEDIDMRIEDRLGFQNRPYEIIRFIGGPTGHEAFEIDTDFARCLTEDAPEGYEGRLTICAGGVRYDECWVSADEVLSYLLEFRPDHIPEDLVPINLEVEQDYQQAPEPRRLPWMK